MKQHSRATHDLRNIASVIGLLGEDISSLRQALDVAIDEAEIQQTIDVGIVRWISERTPEHKMIADVLRDRHGRTGLDALCWVLGLLRDNSYDVVITDDPVDGCREILDRKDNLICSGGYARCVSYLRCMVLGANTRDEIFEYEAKGSEVNNAS